MLSANATPGDGIVLGATKVIDHGPDNLRFNVVFIAEGFTAAEQTIFDAAVQEFVADFFSFSPLDSFAEAINVSQINVASDQSGADDPTECGGTGAVAATYFDASFCNGGIRRLLVVNNGTCFSVLNSYVPEWGQAVVIVNSAVFGGSGGAVAVTSLAGQWTDVALHEFGHSAFGLADEYGYWAGCGSGTDRDHHPPSEPVEPNVTTQTDRALVKWNNLIAPETPVPTTVNANCAVCDPQWNPLPEFTVGLYEGAHYYHCDAYRPQFHCMMRDMSPYFCAVCQAELAATLTQYMPPAFTATPRAGAEWLTVDFTYASVLTAYQWTWYFGDGDSAMVEDPSHTYGPGAYDVTLRVITDFGERTAFEEGYITVWADTLTAPEVEARVASAGYWELAFANAVPVEELVLPVTLTNVTSVLFFDSISYVGTRLEHFESKQVVFDSRFSGQLAMRLRADVGGGSPPLSPGDGPIARVHYRIRTNASPGDTSYISTPPLGMYSFEATTYATDYEPVSHGATLQVVPLCICFNQSDFDEDAFLTALDLSEMIDILFNGHEDVQDPDCPMPRADFDCDGFSTALDLSALVDHLFSGGDGPCDPCAT
jgi:PKD repeat protein